MTRRAAIYVRISRDREGGGLGVERQRQDCAELAERLGWAVVTVHSDNDLSAYSGKPRPGYLALLDDLASGVVEGVIAWHTDRLHRSPVELEQYIAVCERGSAPTQTVKAGDLDLATPAGRMVARQLGAVARYEVEHMVERQRRAKQQAAAAGRFRGGRRAFGYEADGLTVRADESREVEAATRAVVEGSSLAAVAKQWNERGVTTSTGAAWTGASVGSLLRRARNAGLVEHAGQVVGEAQWPAIVPVELWRALRVLVDDPRRRSTTGPGRRWLGAGLYLCGECRDGTTLRGAATPGPKRRSVPAYRCRSSNHLSRTAAGLDRYVIEVARERLARPDARDLLVVEPANGQVLADRARLVHERLDELSALFADGTITGAQLATGTARLRGELADIERQQVRAVTGSPFAGVADAADPAAAFAAASVSKQRDVIGALFTVTVHRAPRGRRPDGSYFDPSAVTITWKAGDQ